ncbi:MAG TPA: HEAT repeat domain-containing protein [Candidatus Limnocylindria bacterium]|nr:HEAT repeat domain-containing protein [Candidatus Limnocylindria bacterium]
MTEDWEAAFAGALRKGDPLAAATILRNTGENGWVKRAQWLRARELLDQVAPAPFVRRDWASRLFAHPRRADRELAAMLLAPLVASHRAEVERAVLRLARDDRWDVREAAATLLGEALDKDFEHWVSICRDHMAKPDARVRRAIVVAAKHAARSRAPERAGPLLDLVEPALRDPDQYVRRNLGPFAIGDQLLRSYPEETLARLARWAKDPDETVRWNAAMAFTSAAGAQYAERGLALLQTLANDESRTVARAAGSALRRIQRRRPDVEVV